MGQVEMATGHGGWRIVPTGGAWSPMGGQSLEWPIGGGMEATGGKVMPPGEGRVGDKGGSAAKGATSFFSDCCKMYYAGILQVAALRDTT